ncbi:hypothetical protein GCM10023194_26140 [Planotetraspora phitsanulokensis]|uniref:Uncharacterized protein n=1 Tax=Planotetraspora phitsanulokensis TaxID=575192 RepID=A0A8J3XJF6_9ACTN|nr:hypothetical protein Pph01_69640 [Planotetraspora phitsanulokensis]
MTTTDLSGRTFAVPLTGLILMVGTGLAGVDSPPSPPGDKAEPDPDPLEHAANAVTMATATPAMGNLDRV